MKQAASLIVIAIVAFAGLIILSSLTIIINQKNTLQCSDTDKWRTSTGTGGTPIAADRYDGVGITLGLGIGLGLVDTGHLLGVIFLLDIFFVIFGGILLLLVVVRPLERSVGEIPPPKGDDVFVPVGCIFFAPLDEPLPLRARPGLRPRKHTMGVTAATRRISVVKFAQALEDEGVLPFVLPPLVHEMNRSRLVVRVERFPILILPL